MDGAAGETARGMARRMVLLTAVTAGLALPASASAATFVVTSAADEADATACVAGTAPTDGCSLREAVAAAEADPDADTITFATPLHGTTIELDEVGAHNGLGPTALTITTPVTVSGPTGDDGVTLARSALAPSFRLLYVAPSGTLTLERLTLTGGLAQGGNGGGSANGGGGGGAGLGGAIFNQGTLQVRASTLTANAARGGGGGSTAPLGDNIGGGGGGSVAGDGQASCCQTLGAGAPDGGGNGGLTREAGGGSPADAATPGGFGGGGGGGGTSGLRWDNFYQRGAAGGFGGGGGGGTGGAAMSAPGGAGGWGGGAGGQGRMNQMQSPGSAGSGGGGAGLGGAIFNHGGHVDVTNSTLALNTTVGGPAGTSIQPGGAGFAAGGAIFTTEATRNATTYPGTVAIASSTLAANTASGGSGVYRLAGTVSIAGSVVGTAGGAPAIDGAYTDGGDNLVGVDAALDARGLRDNGGPTPTWAAAGPAIDAGATGPATDQRGVGRPVDGDGNGDAKPDVGAFEADAAVGLADAAHTISEKGGVASIVVRRTGTATGAAGVTVRLTGSPTVTGADMTITAPGGASVLAPDGDADIPLTWADGDTAPKTVTVTGVDDAADEADEEIAVALTGLTGPVALGRSTAKVTLADDDQATLSVLDGTVVEGDDGAGTGTVRLRLDGPTERAVTATVSTSAGTATPLADYEPVPIGNARNLALEKPATQSTTHLGGVASRAVDGNLDGDWGAGSVIHTAPGDPDPYWEVDLGAVEDIGSVNLHSRTGCCEATGGDLWVLASDTPLPRAFAAAKAAADAAVHVPAHGRPAVAALRASGRYVRVQREGDAAVINLAEVQVLSQGMLEEANVAVGKPSTQSSTHLGGVASRANDGNANGDWGAGSVIHTTEEADPSWQVDLGSVQDVGAVQLWGRTDAAPERTANLWVLVSYAPLPAAFADAKAAATIAVQSGTETRGARLPIGARGRFVRVQREGTGTLNLAEVQVLQPTVVRIPAGTQEVTVPLRTRGDHRVEPGETFTVQAASVTGAALGDGSATVTIEDDDHAPTATTDAFEVDEDTAGGTVPDVLANDADADGDTFTLTGHTQPAHGTVTRNGTTFAYVPPPGFVGPDPFTYTVEDQHGNVSTGTVAVVVRNVNDPPALDPIADASTDEDVPVSAPLVLADVDGVEPLTLSARATANAGLLGAVAFTGTGANRTAVVTPAADRSGTATVEVTVTDTAGVTAVRTFDLTVAPVNDAPRITVADAATEEGVAADVPVALLDPDDAVAGATLTAASASDLVGAVTVSGSGAARVVRVVPVPGRSGTATVDLKAADAHGATTTRAFTVTISPTPPPPPPPPAPPAPQAPGQSGPPAGGTSAPRTGVPRDATPALAVTAVRMSSRGVLAARVAAPGAGKVTVKATVGKRAVAQGTASARAAGTVAVTLKAAKSKRKAKPLRKRATVTLAVTFTPAQGKPTTVRLQVTLPTSKRAAWRAVAARR